MQGKTQPRRLARMLAFQFLYSQRFCAARTEEELRQAFKTIPMQDPQQEEPECEGFAWDLSLGVWEKQTELDDIIKQYAKNWRLDRVGRVELGLLRIAIYEIMFRDDVPTKVAINEAIELNRQFGEEKSGAFLNGILDAISKSAEGRKDSLPKKN